MSEIRLIIRKYMSNIYSIRGFAGVLNEKLEKDTISHTAIANWLSGTNPATDFLILLLSRYRDWRFDFAMECLAAKDPDVWGDPDGVVWEAGREIEERKKNQVPISTELQQTKSS